MGHFTVVAIIFNPLVPLSHTIKKIFYLSDLSRLSRGGFEHWDFTGLTVTTWGLIVKKRRKDEISGDVVTRTTGWAAPSAERPETRGQGGHRCNKYNDCSPASQYVFNDEAVNAAEGESAWDLPVRGRERSFGVLVSKVYKVRQKRISGIVVAKVRLMAPLRGDGNWALGRYDSGDSGSTFRVLSAPMCLNRER